MSSENRHSIADLQRLFENVVTVSHIAEFDLCTCGTQDSCSDARQLMDSKGFDILPLEKDGKINSYIGRDTCHGHRQCGECAVLISPELLIADSTPIVSLLESMGDKLFLFVLKGSKVGGIVTRADLQKLPVRLFLFGLITLVEMQLLRIIRKHFERHADAWQRYLSRDRLKYARAICKGRESRKEEIDLLDCLQLCDRRDIILKSPDLPCKLKQNKKDLRDFLKSVESLRDKLAHAHRDISTGYSWEEIIKLVPDIDQFVRQCEEF